MVNVAGMRRPPTFSGGGEMLMVRDYAFFVVGSDGCGYDSWGVEYEFVRDCVGVSKCVKAYA